MVTEVNGFIDTCTVKISSSYFNIIPEIFSDSAYIEHGTTETIYLWTEPINSYCSEMEYPYTYTAEIIKGGEYGELIDQYRDIRGDEIEGIEQWYGYSDINFEANGIEPLKQDTIIIKFSTSIPEIDSVLFELIVAPSSFVVTVVPENISAGESAQIIIKKRNPDGTLSDYSPEQKFEIGMLDGCILGNLIANGDSLKYFPEIGLPIYFLADTTADSGTVRVRVGLIGSGGGGTAGNILTNSSVIKSRKIDEIRKELKTKASKEIKPEKDVKNNSTILNSTEEAYCDIFEITWETQKDVQIYIGDDCGNPDWACPEELKIPSFDVKEIYCTNGTFEQSAYIKYFCEEDERRWGFFKPLYTYQDFNVETCYNKTEKSWQFNFIEKIFLDAYLAFCPTCITKEGKVIIEEEEEIKSKIPENEICNALDDFEKQKEYGAIVKYKIKKATMTHERVHKEDFFYAISEVLYNYPKEENEKYISKYTKPGWSCKDCPTQQKADDKTGDYLREKLQDFLSELKTVYAEKTGANDEEKRKEYEKKCWDDRSEVQTDIKNYITKLNDRLTEINKNRSKSNKIKCN
jgi:hypothetical protein